MKHIRHRLLTFAVASVIVLSAKPLAPGHFSAQSPFASGHWVGIGVKESGLYEISYDRLRELGFSDPAKVGVFGYGGASLPENFESASGEPLIFSSAPPVSVLHLDGRLLFYARGPREAEVSLTPDSSFPQKAAYARMTRNCYSRQARYLLSDTSSSPMPEGSLSAEGAEILPYGIGLSSPEVDTRFNPFRSGRIYAGEPLDDDIRSYTLPMPLARAGRVNMEGRALGFTPDDPISFTFGFGPDVRYQKSVISTPVPAETSFQRSEANPAPSPEGKISFRARGLSAGQFVCVSAVAVSYPKSFPATGQPFSQERYLLPGAAPGATVAVPLPSPSTLALDITRPGSPQLLRPSGDSSLVALSNPGGCPEVLVFDPDAKQKDVEIFGPITDSGLRARASAGADMLVITTPALEKSALRFADMHAATDGLKVAVATTAEIYNEFSAGAPDPMALRALVRMMRDNPSPRLRNVLLLGPLRADMLGAESLDSDFDPCSFIPAFQTELVSEEVGAYNFNDFIGLADDYSEAPYLSRNIDIGVGVMPCVSPAEADLFTDKTAAFLSDTGLAYRLNLYMSSCDAGDDHLHAVCCDNSLSSLRDETANDFIHTPVYLDAYPRGESRNLFLRKMDTSPLLISYFGHGKPEALSSGFIACDHVSLFRNTPLSFMTFLGCDLTVPDKGVRGIGEQLILNTTHGIFGGLVSTRAATAMGNDYVFLNVFRHMARTGDADTSPLRQRPLSLGESCAMWKSGSARDEVGAYSLMADPSLTLPLPMLAVDAVADRSEITAGTKIRVEGSVKSKSGMDGDSDAALCEGFDGEAVVRLLAPSRRISCPHHIMKGASDYSFDIEDVTVGIVSAPVADGHFTAELTVPSAAAGLAGDARIFIAAYSPESRLGAGGQLPVSFVPMTDESDNGDNVAPSVDELSFDACTSTVTVMASDNEALSFSSLPMADDFVILLDGTLPARPSAITPRFDGSQKAYTVKVPLWGLSQGPHTVEVNIIDAAGNETSAEMSFIAGAPEADITLAAEGQALREEIRLTAEGYSGSSSLRLTVDSADGTTVAVLPFNAPGHVWDGTDEAGRRLPAGVYTLHLKDDSGSFSNPLVIPVLSSPAP